MFLIRCLLGYPVKVSSVIEKRKISTHEGKDRLPFENGYFVSTSEQHGIDRVVFASAAELSRKLVRVTSPKITYEVWNVNSIHQCCGNIATEEREDGYIFLFCGFQGEDQGKTFYMPYTCTHKIWMVYNENQLFWPCHKRSRSH